MVSPTTYPDLETEATVRCRFRALFLAWLARKNAGGRGPGLVVTVAHIPRRYSWMIDKVWNPPTGWSPSVVKVDGRSLGVVSLRKRQPLFVSLNEGEHTVRIHHESTDVVWNEVSLKTGGSVASVRFYPSRISGLTGNRVDSRVVVIGAEWDAPGNDVSEGGQRSLFPQHRSGHIERAENE